MWIRSQDRKRLVEIKDCIGTTEDGRVYKADSAAREDVAIGKYATEGRAMEVMDEIHRYIEEVEKVKLNASFYNPQFCPKAEPDFKIFVMPEE